MKIYTKPEGMTERSQGTKPTNKTGFWEKLYLEIYYNVPCKLLTTSLLRNGKRSTIEEFRIFYVSLKNWCHNIQSNLPNTL